MDPEGHDLPFNKTQSAMMSREGQPAFVFAVFDCFERPDEGFILRHIRAQEIVAMVGQHMITILEHVMVRSLEEFITYADKCVEGLYEGAIIRAPEGPYKSGRSTFNQGWLLKYKSWSDAEGQVIGFHELMRNDNVGIGDKFGLAKRSSHKDNMVPMNTLGALLLQTTWGELRIGTGFDMAYRKEIWMRNTDMEEMYRNKDTVPPDLGRTVTFKYQTHGMQNLPRFPVFLRFREEE